MEEGSQYYVWYLPQFLGGCCSLASPCMAQGNPPTTAQTTQQQQAAIKNNGETATSGDILHAVRNTAETVCKTENRQSLSMTGSSMF